MLFDMIIIFIIILILCLILTVFLMEDRPLLAIPFVMIGMVFSIICTYGMWDIEFYNNNFNYTTGYTTMEVTHISSYGDPYSYLFVLMFFVFMLLFFRVGQNMWRLALETEGEMNINYEKK